MFKLEIKPVWVSKKRSAKSNEEAPITNPPIIDIDSAEAAAERLGKKAVIGAVVVVAATAAAGAVATIAVHAFDHAINR